MMDVEARIDVLPSEWKCLRCKKYSSECSRESNNYNLCIRCQDYMLREMNYRCVSCHNDEAIDNLCNDCRIKRIGEYDARIRKEMEINQ